MTNIFVRASALSGWADCPRRGAANLIPGEIKAAGYVLRELPQNIGAVVGTAVHRAAQVMLDEKIRTGVLAPDTVASDAGIESLHEGLKLGSRMDRETPDGRVAEIQVLRMQRSYRGEVATYINPIRVESQFEAEVSPGLIMTGRADVIAQEPGQVDDLKSGKRLSSHAPQVGAYSLLAKSHGLDIQSAGIDFIQRVGVGVDRSTKLPRQQPPAVRMKIRLEHAEVAAVSIISHIASAIRIFRQGSVELNMRPGEPWAFPSNPSSLLCGEKYCPAHSCGPKGFCQDFVRKEDVEE